MKFALVPQVDQDLQLWADPKDRLLPHNCAPPKANKVPRVSQWDWIAVYLLEYSVSGCSLRVYVLGHLPCSTLACDVFQDLQREGRLHLSLTFLRAPLCA